MENCLEQCYAPLPRYSSCILNHSRSVKKKDKMKMWFICKQGCSHLLSETHNFHKTAPGAMVIKYYTVVYSHNFTYNGLIRDQFCYYSSSSEFSTSSSSSSSSSCSELSADAAPPQASNHPHAQPSPAPRDHLNNTFRVN